MRLREKLRVTMALMAPGEETVPQLREWLFNEPPHTPPYIVEDVDRVQPRRLFSAFGIDWMASSSAWVSPVWMVAVGVVIALVAESHAAAGTRLLLGLVYGALILASILAHYLGGAVAGRMVHAPMRQVIFTATLAYNVYDESREYPSRVHLIRGLGEPAANLILGATMLSLYLAGNQSHLVFFLAVLNLAFFIIAMAPFPTMHGGVLLRNLRSWRRD
jgi:hypothetical protein